MTKTDHEDLPLALLRGVVDLCKEKRLVRTVAEAMQLKPQAMYAWMGNSAAGAPVLTRRAARMRLLAISHLKHPMLGEVAARAAAGVAEIERREASGEMQ
jgi:hypothetical protein